MTRGEIRGRTKAKIVTDEVASRRNKFGGGSRRRPVGREAIRRRGVGGGRFRLNLHHIGYALDARNDPTVDRRDQQSFTRSEMRGVRVLEEKFVTSTRHHTMARSRMEVTKFRGLEMLFVIVTVDLRWREIEWPELI